MTGSLASPEAADGKPRLFTPRPPGHPGTRQDGSHYASFLRDSTGPEPGPQLPPGSYLQNGASKRKLPPLGAQPTQTQAAGGSKAPWVYGFAWHVQGLHVPLHVTFSTTGPLTPIFPRLGHSYWEALPWSLPPLWGITVSPVSPFSRYGHLLGDPSPPHPTHRGV